MERGVQSQQRWSCSMANGRRLVETRTWPSTKHMPPLTTSMLGGIQPRQRFHSCSRAVAQRTPGCLVILVIQRLAAAQVGEQIAYLLFAPILEQPFRHQRLRDNAHLFHLIACQRDILSIWAAQH